MKQGHYVFVTVWKLDAPIEKVWGHLVDIEDWPTWWKGVLYTKIVEHHGEEGHGIGSRIETAWKSWLPYTLHFVLTIMVSDPQTQKIVAKAEGDLNGTGTWVFTEENNQTIATYTWEVSTTKPWMNLVAPFARPIFEHAHDTIMQWGEDGLRKLLATEA